MEKKLILFLIILLNTTLLFAQNHAPEVTNVTFSQRTDGSFLVDIYYDLRDVNGNLMNISMAVSGNGGSTWNFSCNHLYGNIGENISSGNNKHITWDFGAEHPQTYSDQIQIKIIADDGVITLTDIDGNVYKTVKIGNQLWMAENLKVTRYRNGETIPNVTVNSEWYNLTTGACSYYDNNTSNIATYGRLYNWYAVVDSRQLAPAGWHMPTDEEWKEMEMYLGMSQSDADGTYWRGTDEGSKLKSTSGWYSNGNGTNESGFSALPGGYRIGVNGSFKDMSKSGYFWSSTESINYHAMMRYLNYNNSAIGRNNGHKRDGYGVRCIRD